VESLAKEKILSIDIQLWLDPQGRMWLFWTQRHILHRADSPEHLQLWAITCENPDAEVLEWSEPRYIAPGFLRCQPTVLADGRWIVCAYAFGGEYYCYSESCDNGKTWSSQQGGQKNVPTNFDETMILERRDGSLWMLARTTSSGFLAETISTDGGKNWTPGKLTTISNPSSRFFLKRLKSGRILLIKNNDSRERINMTALLSEDDGISWKYSLLIDSRETSYPDAVESADGTIFMVHDCHRVGFKEILCSRFTENDIINGVVTDYDSYLCQIVSKAPARPWNAAETQKIKDEDARFNSMRKKFNA
jgi:hypothetical protein